VGFGATENEEGHPDEARSVRKRRGSLQDVEEADFDMEEFLAGTPLTPGNFAAGTGRVPDVDDATATELWCMKLKQWLWVYMSAGWSLIWYHNHMISWQDIKAKPYYIVSGNIAKVFGVGVRGFEIRIPK
jgi:hypothetical protein